MPAFRRGKDHQRYIGHSGGTESRGDRVRGQRHRGGVALGGASQYDTETKMGGLFTDYITTSYISNKKLAGGQSGVRPTLTKKVTSRLLRELRHLTRSREHQQEPGFEGVG